MHVSNESLLVILLVGVVAGWLAGHVVQGTGLGLIGDMVIGVIGAFVGDWLMPQLGIHLGVGTIGAIVNATIGAILLLLIIRLVRSVGGSGSGWGSRWESRHAHDERAVLLTVSLPRVVQGASIGFLLRRSRQTEVCSAPSLAANA